MIPYCYFCHKCLCALLKVRNDVYIGQPADLIKRDCSFVHKCVLLV